MVKIMNEFTSSFQQANQLSTPAVNKERPLTSFPSAARYSFRDNQKHDTIQPQRVRSLQPSRQYAFHTPATSASYLHAGDDIRLRAGSVQHQLN